MGDFKVRLRNKYIEEDSEKIRYFSISRKVRVSVIHLDTEEEISKISAFYMREWTGTNCFLWNQIACKNND